MNPGDYIGEPEVRAIEARQLGRELGDAGELGAPLQRYVFDDQPEAAASIQLRRAGSTPASHLNG